ncbi:unnamed protein product [Durusdinium trenchii]|uniref:Uncharacterized protein n=1 Tax=Durusdinium trenchii TaxID=1381693 RepID=A0ABP0QVI0_9DINO
MSESEREGGGEKKLSAKKDSDNVEMDRAAPICSKMGEEQREEGLQRREEGLRERRANRGLGGLDLGQPCCQGSCGFDPLGMRPSPTFDEEYMRMNRDLDEEPANLQRWKAWLSLVFLVLITGPAVVAFFLTAQEYVDPLVRLVGPEDSQQVNEIFFGGNPWLISCVTEKTAHKKPPRVLEAAAEVLRPRGVRVARVHCWEPLETKKGRQTLAQRFGFRSSPPVVMASSGGGKPSFLAATGLSAEALAAKVLAEVIPEAATVPKAQVKDRRSTSQSRREPVGRRPESGAEEDISSNDVHEEVLQEEEDVNLDA